LAGAIVVKAAVGVASGRSGDEISAHIRVADVGHAGVTSRGRAVSTSSGSAASVATSVCDAA
jgi:hypothetical protein